jgi:hypothetical protein
LHHLEAAQDLSDLYPDEKNAPEATPLILIIGIVSSAFAGLAWKSSRHHTRAFFLSHDAMHRLLKRALHAWVYNLRRAEVDLTAYGRKERSLLHSNGCYLRGVYDADSDGLNSWLRPIYYDFDGMQSYHIRIIDLIYDAEPENWDVVFVIEFEAMARDFWGLIEKQALTGMPGSWVE